MPIQRSLLSGQYRNTEFVLMKDLTADMVIVEGVDAAPQGPGWRWTREKAVLKFFLSKREGWRAVLDFAVAGATFSQTGPVTLTVSVNGRVLETVRYTSSGEKHIDKPVPAEWIHHNADNTLTIEIDPPFITDTDKVKLGVVLSAAGFKPND
jgi:hypothetical protein